MAKTRAKKESEVKVMADGLKAAKSVVFADIASLKASDAADFRRKARKENVDIVTAKKTLLRIALKEAGIASVDVSALKGSVALLIGLEDAVVPAKVFETFRKTHESVSLLGGLFEAKLMSVEDVKTLASLPSKQELIARVVGSIRAPLSGLVNVLQGNLRGLVCVVNAIKDSKA